MACAPASTRSPARVLPGATNSIRSSPAWSAPSAPTDKLARSAVGAKFPVLKDIDKFVFSDTPVDEGQVRELASGAFLDAKRNAIFIGGTGTGNTHLCIGVASAVIRARARGRFFNLVDLEIG